MPFKTLIGVDADLLVRGVLSTEDLYSWVDLGSLVFVVGDYDFERTCRGDVVKCLYTVSREFSVQGGRLFITGKQVSVPGWNVVNTSHACVNLGSGASVFRGCVNIDKRLLPGVDLVLDLEDGYLPFPDGFFTVAYMIDVIEHVSWRRIPRLMSEINRVLNCGGRLVVRTPDIGLIAKMVLDWGMPKIEHPDVGEFRKYMLISYFLYGNQDYPEDTHKAGFTIDALQELLNMHGFEVSIIKNPPTEHPNIFAVATKPCS